MLQVFVKAHYGKGGGKQHCFFSPIWQAKERKEKQRPHPLQRYTQRLPKTLPIGFQLLMIPTTPSIDLGSIPSSYEPFVDAQDANHSKRESKIWYFGTFYHSAVGAHPIKHRHRMSPSGDRASSRAKRT